jgi:hypothetical protein
MAGFQVSSVRYAHYWMSRRVLPLTLRSALTDAKAIKGKQGREEPTLWRKRYTGRIRQVSRITSYR